MNGPVGWNCLVEDETQKRFVYWYLKERGLHRREIRFIPFPSGHGSGEQHVRKQYPVEVTACRQRSSRAATRLIVMIDADTKPVQKRHDELEAELNANGRNPREKNEPIAILVPKRNIETWIVQLAKLEQDVNEDMDFSRREDVKDHVADAAKRFFLAQCPLPLPSLERGVAECQRFS